MGTSESKIKEQIFNSLNYSHSDSKFRKLLKKIPKKLDINNIRDESGNTIINLASQLGRRNIIQELIHQGCNLNLPNNEGLTPIHQAINNSQEEVTTILLKNGANLNTISETYHTPLITAIQKGDDKFIEILLGYQDKSSENDSSSSANNGICTYGGSGISSNIDINFADKNKMTPLMWTVQQEGKDGLIRFLLNSGADINKRDNQSRTAIYIAKSLSKLTTVSILSEHFCTVNKIPKLKNNNNNNNSNNNNSSTHQNISSGNLNNPINIQPQQTLYNNNNQTTHNHTNNNTFSPQNQTTHNATDSLASSWSSSDSLPPPPLLQTNPQNVIDNMFNTNNTTTNQIVNVQYNIIPKPTSSSSLDLEVNNNINKHKRENSTLQSTISSSSKDEKCCKVCWERPSDTVLLWCGHYAICFYCSQYLSNCPLCISPIERVQKVFVS